MRRCLKRLANWLKNILTSGDYGTSHRLPLPACILPPSSSASPTVTTNLHLNRDVSRRYHPLRHGLQPRHSCPRSRLRIRTVISIPPFLSPPRVPLRTKQASHCPPRPRPRPRPSSVEQNKSIRYVLKTSSSSCRILPSCLASVLPSSSSFDRAVGDAQKKNIKRKRKNETFLTSRIRACGLASGKSPVRGTFL